MARAPSDSRITTAALTIALLAVAAVLVAIVPVAVRLGSAPVPGDAFAPPGGSTTPPANADGSTGSTGTSPVGVAPSRPTTTFGRPVSDRSSTTARRRTPWDDRLADASGADGCEPVAPDVALEPEVDPATYVRPATPDAAALVPGSRRIVVTPEPPTAVHLTWMAVGSADVTVVHVAPDRRTDVVVVGRFDRGSGVFTRVAAFTDCTLQLAVTDDVRVVVAASGPDGTLVFAVDLVGGGLPWRWIIPRNGAHQLVMDGDRVLLGSGGYRQSPSEWGIVTLDAASGAVESSAASGESPPGGLVDADEGLWFAIEASGRTRYTQLDPATVATIRTIEAPGPPIAPSAIRSGGLWRVSGTTLERHSLVDGTVTTVPLESVPGDEPTLAVGPSGIWVQSSGDPAGVLTTLTRVDPDTATVRSTTRFPTTLLDVSRSTEQVPFRPDLQVDAFGFTYEGVAPDAPACACRFELRAP